MTDLTPVGEIGQIQRLAQAASLLGFEIVDIAGFLDLVEAQALDQKQRLDTLDKGAQAVTKTSAALKEAAIDLGNSVARTGDDVATSAEAMRVLGRTSREVAEWVQDLSERSADVGDTLTAVKHNNAQIAAIAMQVNTLAINAKIEAARAGESGRGFAVVAEAINELSQKTREAADEISTNIEALTQWIARLGEEAEGVAGSASTVLAHSRDADDALGRMEKAVGETQAQAQRINVDTDQAHSAVSTFGPSIAGIGDSILQTSKGIEETHARVDKLIDTSENIVQLSAGLGGMTEDAPFIDFVCSAAAQIGAAFEAAVKAGRLTHAQLFDTSYVPIPGTNPEQVRTGYVDILDTILPAIQEPALAFDPKVVFCAAVDQNGYLPTHNNKFSQPQGDDPVWNTANCRNRRIFDDRVGLKAGRNTRPFLLQVYRRDMGGGEFRMMKDLSAPIFVNAEHWGGLRLAYTL